MMPALGSRYRLNNNRQNGWRQKTFHKSLLEKTVNNEARKLPLPNLYAKIA
jgi:hypothetical protein